MFNEMPKLKEAMNWFNDHFQDQGLDVGIGIAYAGAAEDSGDGLRLILGVAEGDTGQAIDNIPELAAALLVGGMDPLSAALNLTGIAGEEGEEEPIDPAGVRRLAVTTLCMYQMPGKKRTSLQEPTLGCLLDNHWPTPDTYFIR